MTEPTSKQTFIRNKGEIQLTIVSKCEQLLLVACDCDWGEEERTQVAG